MNELKIKNTAATIQLWQLPNSQQSQIGQLDIIITTTVNSIR